MVVHRPCKIIVKAAVVEEDNDDVVDDDPMVCATSDGGDAASDSASGSSSKNPNSHPCEPSTSFPNATAELLGRHTWVGGPFPRRRKQRVVGPLPNVATTATFWLGRLVVRMVQASRKCVRRAKMSERACVCIEPAHHEPPPKRTSSRVGTGRLVSASGTPGRPWPTQGRSKSTGRGAGPRPGLSRIGMSAPPKGR
jgi:hypothetical protein